VTLVWLWISPRYFISLSEDDEERLLPSKRLTNGAVDSAGGSVFQSDVVMDAQFKAHTVNAARRRKRRVE
jgi:hypothetical protein